MEEEPAGDADVSMKTPIVSNEDPNQTTRCECQSHLVTGLTKAAENRVGFVL